MWHASTASNPMLNLSKDQLRVEALNALEGVGDPHHQWEQWTGRAFHVRRRLTPEEQEFVGPAIDIRGTDEYARRLAACTWLPPGWTE